MKQFKENVRTYEKLIKEKKKQIDVLLQQQEHYKNENERQKADYKEHLNFVHQMQDQYKDENKKRQIEYNAQVRKLKGE